MRSLFAATQFALVLSATFLTGCTDVCDEAAVVLDEYCGMAVDPGTEVECDGERQAFSQCIVDHPGPACDYFYDPVAGADNAFGRCVAAIP
ncbi:MAG: hypothetical protein DRJ42_06340 [Deltaproteobacteria bacterium]|nr:MAG: hypothetical protein DRJ42_06340 [Deltaproteobacteria bacterium]